MRVIVKIGLGMLLLCLSAGIEAGPALAADEGAKVFQEQCVRCHDVNAVKEKLKGKQPNRKEWVATIERMEKYGAKVPPGKQDVLVNYLMKTFK